MNTPLLTSRRCLPPAPTFRALVGPGLVRFELLLGLLALGSLSLKAGDPLVLIQHGQSHYRIVVASNAIPSERYAAQELQRYLERMSGVRLPLVTDAERPVAHEILLGDNLHLRKLGVRPLNNWLGTDGFSCGIRKGRLYIQGGRPRGTLNGVYSLLEEQLGVRWFTPELERVPVVRQVSVSPAFCGRYNPAFEYREVFWTEMMRDADFAARHRLNGDHYNLGERHGGPAVVYFPFVHSFDALIPPELFKEHPEYFPLIGGQRKDGYVQRCLTNPDVLRLSIERVRQWIREHPEATIISVSQNDTFNYCLCEACKGIDEAEGSPCGTLLRFVNAVAEAIEKDHPGIRIDTLAYQYTRKPPKTIRPHRNVIIRLCSIECCFAHPLSACPSEANRRFREDVTAWQPVAPRLYVWDYTPNFAHYQQIFPNFDALQPNVYFYASHGVQGLFEQGNYSRGGLGEMGPLRAYLLAKLLWNPLADVRRHTEEFTQAYYGRAAGKIREYLEITHRPVRGTGRHAYIFDSPKSAYLESGMLVEAERVLDEAEALAEDETTRFHVQVARLPVWYAQLATRALEGWSRTQRLRQFLEVARKAGITNISEGKELGVWAKEMGE